MTDLCLMIRFANLLQAATVSIYQLQVYIQQWLHDEEGAMFIYFNVF